MTHHPHVHMIVPGGGLSSDGSRWIAAKPRLLELAKQLGDVGPSLQRQLHLRLGQHQALLGALGFQRLEPLVPEGRLFDGNGNDGVLNELPSDASSRHNERAAVLGAVKARPGNDEA